MRLVNLSSLTRLAAIVLAAASLTGCGSTLDGTYTPADGEGIIISSITFKSGGKCELTGLGMTKEGAYELEGNKVKITVGGETNILTMDDKGCLDGGGIIGKFCKGGKGSDGGSAKNNSSSSSAKNSAPSGVYECKVPDGSMFSFEFSSGGKVKMIMTQNGRPDVTEGNWVHNGDDIMIQSAEGPPMNLKRNGTSLVADMGGMQMTFVKK